ncbi:MAG: hypothetical protein KAV82_08615 [Phycisphaerae bacterium]|nr:hypothetical protein [Phycisphaerae bacterium]
MKTSCGVGAMVLLGLGCVVCGCRAHPASLGLMLVGDVVADADVDKREKELLGKPPAAADAMFGERTDTFIDMNNTSSQALWYPVDVDLLTVDRWVVEVSEGEIVVLTKTKENIDGVEDVIRSVGLRFKVIGKTPAQCRREGNLKKPVAKFRSVKTDSRVFVYDVRNFTNLRGARYCLLWFDSSGECNDVKLVGVSASTKKEPLGSNSP